QYAAYTRTNPCLGYLAFSRVRAERLSSLPVAPGDEAWITQSSSNLAIAEGRALGIDYDTARCFEHGLAGGDVPLHGRTEAWINASIASRDQQKLQRAARARPLGDLELGQKRLRVRIEMRMTDNRDEAFGSGDADTQR